jgi:galactose oxidase
MQVLTWSAYVSDNFSGNTVLAQTATATLDPESLTSSFATITTTKHDMFCPGISLLGDGNYVVTGGTASEKTSIYNVASDKWEPGPNMKLKRGYQSTATLSTGEVSDPAFKALSVFSLRLPSDCLLCHNK